MTQETPHIPSPQSESVSVAARSPQLSRRVKWGLIGLVVVTVAALWGAWHWPDNTLMHFGLVTQVAPVVYLFLMWWGVDTSSAESDVI